MKLRTLTAIAAGVALGFAPLTTTQGADPVPATEPYCGPTVVAHRGGTEAYVENTRKAFNHAYENGVRAVELDVHWTSTNTPMVIHDKTIDRVTNGSGYVRNMSYTKLRSYRTADGQVIPSLWEVLKDGKKYNVKYFVELKVNPTSKQWSSFKNRFTGLDVWGQTVIMSFDKATLLEAKSHGFTQRGWLDGSTGFQYASTIKKYGNYYFKQYTGVTPWRSDYWNDRGIKVIPWTVDSNPAEWEDAATFPNQGVITNTPTEYLTWARGRC